MPYKKIYKKKAGRRYNKAKVSKKMVVNKALAPFAQRYITRMKYCDQFQLDGTQSIWRFSLNNINKPNIIASGHQPSGHDTLTTIYNRFRVIKVFWRIESTLTEVGANNNSYQLVAVPANENVNPLNAADAREDPRAKYIVQTTGGPTRVLKGVINLPSLMGRTPAQYMADDRFQSQYDSTTGGGSQPAELAILNIFTNNLLSTVLLPITCMITMTYVVESFDPKILARSQ